MFFLLVTPFMHDFWAVPEDQRQNEMAHFLKNLELFGVRCSFWFSPASPGATR